MKRVLKYGGDSQVRGHALYLHFIKDFERTSRKCPISRGDYEILLQYMLATGLKFTVNRDDMNDLLANVVRGAKNIRKLQSGDDLPSKSIN